MTMVKQRSRASGSGGTRDWSVFQEVFSEFSGLSVQFFNENGVPVLPAPQLPALCAFLQRHPKTQTACQNDCFRKVAACGVSRKIVSARCYAGLSYRVVPLLKSNRLHSVILVGRVLTEVFGDEQYLGFVEKHKLSLRAFGESLAAMRSLGSSELDTFAASVRHLAVTLIAGDVRVQHSRSLLERSRNLTAFARQATAFHDHGPEGTRGVLEALCRIFAASGAAVLLPGGATHRAEVHSSIGLGEGDLDVLANQDWSQIFARYGSGATLVLADRKEMLKAGLDCAAVPLVVQRLDHGSQVAGYVVLSGAALGVRDVELLSTASAFVAARMVHLICRERAQQRDEESRLLVQMVETCRTAHSVEELLPLALEAAMCGLHARRGSILLAEEKGRITNHVLRGDHAPISGSVRELRPDSVSHKVFFDRRPLLVQDTGRETGLTPGGGQFPYVSRSFMSVPLRENGHALGVLHLTERDGEEVFTPDDLSLLERLSLQAAAEIRKVQLEEEVQTLRVASAIDPVTGVYNRRHLDERLKVETQRAHRFGQQLAVAMIDIDSFKNVNDTMGHEHGDQVLRMIAKAIRQQLRSIDVLARYGGDEFVLILPGTNSLGAMTIVEKIRAKVASLKLPGDQPSALMSRYTVSIGLAVYPETTALVDELLPRADQSLLLAKSAGKNTILHVSD